MLQHLRHGERLKISGAHKAKDCNVTHCSPEESSSDLLFMNLCTVMVMERSSENSMFDPVYGISPQRHIVEVNAKLSAYHSIPTSGLE